MSEQSVFGDGGYTAFAIGAQQRWAGNTSKLWVCVGQADAWDGGVTPPEDPSTIPNPIVYKRADAKLCRVLTQDEIDGGMSGDTTYTIYQDDGEGGTEKVVKHIKYLTTEEAIAGKYHTIFVYQTLLPDDAGGSSISFRAIGFVADLTPTTGNETKDALLPSEVSDIGCVIAVWHRDDAKTIASGDQITPRILLQITSDIVAI